LWKLNINKKKMEDNNEKNEIIETNFLDEKDFSQKDERKKIKSLISLVILLGGLFVGSLFVDIVQLFRGQGFSQKAVSQSEVIEAHGKTWVAYQEPMIEAEIITDEKCVDCDPSEALVWLRRMIPTISAKNIDISSEEGKKISEEFKVKTLPAFVFPAAIEETEFFAQAQSIFNQNGEKYLLDTVQLGVPAGKYLSLPDPSSSNAKVGPEDAKVKIVEFSDFQCPYCKAFHTGLKKTLAKYEGKIQYVYKHFPLSFHAQAENAALASECATEQGKFLDYANKLFDAQDEWGTTEGTGKFKTYAAQFGLNASQFNQCLDNKKYQDQISQDMQEGQEFGVSGTPATFINGQFRNGVFGEDEFNSLIEAELNK